jgi:hypothetical protein
MSDVRDAHIFIHHNLNPDAEQHHLVKNAAEVREILEKSGKVKAVWQGHYHTGHDSIINGISYHTLGAMCEGEENRYIIAEI